MRGVTAALVLAAIAFLQGRATSEPPLPSTDTLALCAQNYLFLASGTTQGIVTVTLSEKEPRFFLQGDCQLRTFDKILIWWPQKMLAHKDMLKCRKLFLDVHDEVTSRIKQGFDRDALIHELCEPRMAISPPEFQYLVVNSAFLERLRKEFPGNPSPLGVHILTKLKARITLYK